MTRPALPLLVAALALAACRTGAPSGPVRAAPPTRPVPASPTPASPTPTPPAAGSPAAAAPVLSNAAHWFRNAAEQRAAFLQAYRLAGDRVEALSASRAPGTWAVIVDADETLLDNSQEQKERELAGRSFTPEAWTAWVARREARALPGSVPFLERVKALGGRIAVVTNRTTGECPDTQANLRAEKLPFDVVLCKADGARGEKDTRFRQVQDGTAAPGWAPAEVLVYVGDNIQDFPGLLQDVRDDPARLALFGDRYIILPNPMYGSWERTERR